MKTRIILVVAVYQLFLLSSSNACTTFVLKNDSQIVYGRNFDFNIGNGFVISNQKGISKYAFVGNEKNLMTWESKYGSISFNQFGKEFPYGGMNETGLVIAQMYLSQTMYPEIDNRKVISPLQWIQYQLDVSSTVEEVLASDTIMRISKEVPVGIHFLVCDSKGKTATIEFINGEMVSHVNEELQIPLLTNNTYEESISYLKQFDILGGANTIKWDNIYDIEWTNDNTLAINKVFATAANKMMKTQDSSNLINRAFEVLQCVTINNHTKWSTVFDVTNKMIYFKNENRNVIITLALEDFEFDSDKNSILLDIQTAISHNTMTQFIPYSTEINRDYVYKAFIPLMDSGFIPVRLPEAVIEAHARFPETLKIADRKSN